jgi:hypothetical protein
MSKNHNAQSEGYIVRMSLKATDKCGHLVIGGGGRCENCQEVIETEPFPYPVRPPHETTPEELRAEADALTREWEAICDRIGKSA